MSRHIERREQFRKLHDSGMTLAEIAARFGITKQRVSQIINYTPPPRRGTKNQPRRGRISVGDLSKRQAQVAELVAKGLHNSEIAARLGITVGTVKIHIHNIYNKQNLDRRAQLIIGLTPKH